MAQCSACGAGLTRFSERLLGGCVPCMIKDPGKFTFAIGKEAE